MLAAAVAFNNAASSSAVGLPSAPQTPTSFKKLLEGSLEANHALHSDGEEVKRMLPSTGIEPSADMMDQSASLSVPNSISPAHSAELSVDQTLQSAEENFFETIDQVCRYFKPVK